MREMEHDESGPVRRYVMFLIGLPPRRKGKAKRFRQALDLQFRHDMGTMDFDGSRTDAQVEGDRLVGMTANQSVQNVALARSERRDAYPGVMCIGQCGVMVDQQRKTPFKRRKQRCPFKRLFKEVHRALPHCLYRSRDIPVTRQDDHWHGDAAACQFVLNLQPVHIRHSDVEQHTSGFGGPCALQKGDAAIPGRYRKPGCPEHERDRAANRILVVDNMDVPFFSHRLPPDRHARP